MKLSSVKFYWNLLVSKTLLQVMTWCRRATSHYLIQYWPRSMSPHGVTRPQWVNSARCYDSEPIGEAGPVSKTQAVNYLTEYATRLLTKFSSKTNHPWDWGNEQFEPYHPMLFHWRGKFKENGNQMNMNFVMIYPYSTKYGNMTTTKQQNRIHFIFIF